MVKAALMHSLAQLKVKRRPAAVAQ